MNAYVESVEMVESQDETPDASYLEQEGLGFEDRLASYRAGEFYFVGIQARATIHIPHGAGFIIETITSPGLWGIESDSDADYFEEVFREEQVTLRSMLEELGVRIPDRLSMAYA